MNRQETPKKFVLTALGVLSASILTGCSFFGAIKVRAYTDCAWAEPIQAGQETKAWLESLDWPDGFHQFMEAVGDHNELAARNCGQ